MRPYWLHLLFVPLFAIQVSAQSPEPKVIVYKKFSDLEARWRNSGDTTVVVNFWATWCGPCTHELPFFQEIHERYGQQKVKVLLVSLDFKSQLEKRLIPFIRNNNITAEVVHLIDLNANNWIPRVHESWDGALPATLVVRGNTLCFRQGEFESYEDLEAFLTPFIGGMYAPKD